jgi:hypothetical protein
MPRKQFERVKYRLREPASSRLRSESADTYVAHPDRHERAHNRSGPKDVTSWAGEKRAGDVGR